MLFSLRKQAEESAADLPTLITAAQNAAASIIYGEHALRKAGTGERFWQFREYQAGDRPQDIDWRQSGKTDRTYVRERERQIAQTNIFWCSTAKSMDFNSNKSLPTKLESAKIITLALSILMTKAGGQIGLLGDTKRGRASSMVDHIGHVLCEQQTLQDPSNVRTPRHTNLIQISDFLDPLDMIEKQFNTLGGQSNSGLVIQILDPAEIELPFDGRTIFEEPSNDTRENIDHVSSIRLAYQQRINTQIAGIEDRAQRQGWHYILHRTDTNITDTLHRLWTQMSHNEALR